MLIEQRTVKAGLTILPMRSAQAWLTTGAGTRAERFYRRHGWREMGRSLDGQIVFIRAL